LTYQTQNSKSQMMFIFFWYISINCLINLVAITKIPACHGYLVADCRARVGMLHSAIKKIIK